MTNLELMLYTLQTDLQKVSLDRIYLMLETQQNLEVELQHSWQESLHCSCDAILSDIKRMTYILVNDNYDFSTSQDEVSLVALVLSNITFACTLCTAITISTACKKKNIEITAIDRIEELHVSIQVTNSSIYDSFSFFTQNFISKLDPSIVIDFVKQGKLNSLLTPNIAKPFFEIFGHDIDDDMDFIVCSYKSFFDLYKSIYSKL